MPEASLIRTLLLPELSLVSFHRVPDSRVIEVVAQKVPKVEYCPRCATPCSRPHRSGRIGRGVTAARSAAVSRLRVSRSSRAWGSSRA